jgi:uracil-DNA glycosylase
MLPAAWRPALTADEAALLASIEARIEEESRVAPVYPPAALRYHALERVPPEHVRVVILGQDPYHGHGQAHGLAFSVPRGVRVPPSLRNIYAELQANVGVAPANHGDLTAWADEGVLLLNTALSVRGGAAASHADYGWHTITAGLLRHVSSQDRPVAFLLWGAHAQSRRSAIVGDRHAILTAGHPSFFSRHLFLGCRHFSQANGFLRANGRGEVRWALP